MPLQSGARLGPYQVTPQIGASGMGEVYRARGSKLGRDVAITVLPEAVAADAERVARFEREVKRLAQLNHPHIAATPAWIEIWSAAPVLALGWSA